MASAPDQAPEAPERTPPELPGAEREHGPLDPQPAVAQPADQQQAKKAPGPRRGLSYERRMRLVRRGDFERAYRQGARSRGAALVVLTSAGGGSVTRLGLSIGKKAWREAVDRNRARRLIREAFRLEFERLPPHADLIVMAADPRGPWDLASLRAEIADLAWRAWRKYERKVAAAKEIQP